MPERRTVQFKAWNARPLIDILSSRHWHFPVLRNSRAIAKFHNAEIGHFGHNAFIQELIRGSLTKHRMYEFNCTTQDKHQAGHQFYLNSVP